jgi:hypothetical protein
MAITLSLVLAFGIALAFLLRAKVLGFGAAFVAAMFGFYLASTGAAGPVNHFIRAVFTALSHIH